MAAARQTLSSEDIQRLFEENAPKVVETTVAPVVTQPNTLAPTAKPDSVEPVFGDPLKSAGTSLLKSTRDRFVFGVIRSNLASSAEFQAQDEDAKIQQTLTALKKSKIKSIKGRELELAKQLVEESKSSEARLNVGFIDEPVSQPALREFAKGVVIPTSAAAFTGKYKFLLRAAINAAGTISNQILGLEPVSVTQVVLAALLPPATKKVAGTGKEVIRHAERLAVQERLLVSAAKEKLDFGAIARTYDISSQFMADRAKEASVNMHRFLRSQSVKGLADARQIKDSIPLASDEVITDLYDKVRQMNVQIDATTFRGVQTELAEELRELQVMFPKRKNAFLDMLAGQPKARVDPLTDPSLAGLSEDARRQIAEQIGEPDSDPNSISFQVIQNGLRVLGEEISSLSKSVVSGNPGSKTNLRQAHKIRNSVMQSLEETAKSDALGAEAKNRLRAANNAFHKNATRKDIETFLERFTKDSTGLGAGITEEVDNGAVLRALADTTDVEAAQLIKNLKILKLYDGFKFSFQRANHLMDRTKRRIARSEGTSENIGSVQRAKTRRQIEFDEAERLSEDIRGDLTPLPGQRVERVESRNLYAAAFAAGLIGSGADVLLRDESDTQSNIKTGGVVATAFVTPVLFSMMLSTKTGQKILINRLAKSRGRLTPDIAGVSAAFLRATTAQIPRIQALPSNSIP